jgi:hypothetical protein
MISSGAAAAHVTSTKWEEKALRYFEDFERGEIRELGRVTVSSGSLELPAPLRPDDEISLTSECVAARPSKSRPGIGIVTTRSVLHNQADEVVMRMHTKFMVRRRP